MGICGPEGQISLFRPEQFETLGKAAALLAAFLLHFKDLFTRDVPGGQDGVDDFVEVGESTNACSPPRPSPQARTKAATEG